MYCSVDDIDGKYERIMDDSVIVSMIKMYCSVDDSDGKYERIRGDSVSDQHVLPGVHQSQIDQSVQLDTR